MGTLEPGDTVIEAEWPFGRRTNLEWCYLLGSFGVRLQGESRTLTALPEKLGFDDVTRQGLPYYGGNITYCIPLTTEAGTLSVCAPHYDGAALRAALDGEPKGYLVYAPYRLTLGEVEKGPHLLELTLLGSRQNAFGPVHLADEKEKWIGQCMAQRRRMLDGELPPETAGDPQPPGGRIPALNRTKRGPCLSKTIFL